MSEGLLDFISTPEGQGLLSAVAGGLASARRGAPLNAIGAGGMAGLMGYGNALDRNQQTADKSRTNQLRDLQIAQMTQGMSDADRQRVAREAALATAPGDVRQAVAMGVPIAEIWKRQNPEQKLETIFDASGKEVKGFARPDGSFAQVGGAKASPLHFADIGGNVVGVDQYTGAPSGAVMNKTQSPDSAASNAVAWANNNLSGQRLAFDKTQAGKPSYHDGAWVSPPTEGNPNGGMVKTPLYTPPKGSPEAQSQASAKVIPIIDEADKLLKDATGSYVGTGADLAAAAFGKSTKGAQTGAKLKALEGSLMMAQPRMEGPQSDKDVALYKQMAGQIGDSTVPIDTRRAALQTIRQLHEKYTQTDSPKQSAISAGGWSATVVK